MLKIPGEGAVLLTGNMVTEYTIASTGQILNPYTRKIDTRLLEKTGINPGLFNDIVMPGHRTGVLKDGIAAQCGLPCGIPVVAVAGHDTASAVAAVPARTEKFAYLSSGTWSLMGIETPEPVINASTSDFNITNEGGVFGTIRLLKNITVDRYYYRSLLKESLDRIFAVKCENVKDAVECKLFGTGLESFTVGSHEFYMGYALKNGLMSTLDMGHFHPTEETYDKISSLLLFSTEIMLHVSRPVRWDSDHVVILNDSVQMLAQEIVWADALSRVNIGLDYFDASINRIGAYVIGIRATQKAFLQALLSPVAQLRKYEAEGRYFERLALLEEAKGLPWNDVFNYFCMCEGVPVAEEFIADIEDYERNVTSKR